MIRNEELMVCHGGYYGNVVGRRLNYAEFTWLYADNDHPSQGFRCYRRGRATEHVPQEN